jgi:hypothetical protein
MSRRRTSPGQLTPEEVVVAALKLLKPSKVQRERCVAHIVGYRDCIEVYKILRNDVSASRSKSKAIETYDIWATRLLTVSDNIADAGQATRRKALKDVIDRTHPRLHLFPGGLLAAWWARPDDKCDLISIDITPQRMAALAAAYFLMRWRPKERLVTTPRKMWWRLAAVLFGSPDIDLYQHLNAVRIYLRDRDFPASI